MFGGMKEDKILYSVVGLFFALLLMGSNPIVNKSTTNKTISYDTLCQVIIFRNREGKSYITTKYKPGEYIDMCEPLGIIVREADRMCNVPKKVIPSNAIPKRVQYSGHINGY